MDLFKKILKKTLYPNMIFVILMFIFSMLFFGMEHFVSYISYVVAFYSLTILCLRIPQIIEWIKKFIKENKYIVRYRTDVNLRINISLYGSLFINVVYSIFQLVLGIHHKSFWFYSMAGYYILLSLIRFYLVGHTKKYKPGENLLIEYKRYNFCGWMMLLLNLTITGIIFFIVHLDRTFSHHQITTIALAAYTFLTFSLSIYNFIKYREYKSPAYSAAKSINLVAACVFMMTLTTTMLTVFGGEEISSFRKILLTIVGTVVSIFILATAIQIIIFTTKNIKTLKGETNERG